MQISCHAERAGQEIYVGMCQWTAGKEFAEKIKKFKKGLAFSIWLCYSVQALRVKETPA